MSGSAVLATLIVQSEVVGLRDKSLTQARVRPLALKTPRVVPAFRSISIALTSCPCLPRVRTSNSQVGAFAFPIIVCRSWRLPCRLPDHGLCRSRASSAIFSPVSAFLTEIRSGRVPRMSRISVSRFLARRRRSGSPACASRRNRPEVCGGDRPHLNSLHTCFGRTVYRLKYVQLAKSDRCHSRFQCSRTSKCHQIMISCAPAACK